jgi:FlaA1/EpsC-like NDP-sugar epimerase
VTINRAEPLVHLRGARVLVTGAAGSIGLAAVEALRNARVVVYPTDLPLEYNGTDQALDVRDEEQVARVLEALHPTHVLHLAGAKHAPEGELEPGDVARTNIGGTENVLRHARDARVVTASTCKACDPETAYGATKLVAERMTLNAGGAVARFYNVPESSGNVFRIWEQIPEDEPIPVAPCVRYFVSMADAVSLLLWAAVLPSGRYTVDPGRPLQMGQVAEDLYPGRVRVPVAPRRGDRTAEPLHARSEWTGSCGVQGLWEIVGVHDVSADVLPPAVEEAFA